MRRVARCGGWAIAALLAWWIACEAMGAEVGIGPLSVFFVVALVTGFAIEFVERRTADPRMTSGAAAGGATIMVWAGVEMAELEIEPGVYIVMFAATFAVHFLALRTRERRAQRKSASRHR